MHHSVSRWISELQEGDPDAAQRLWDVYFKRLIKEARKIMATQRKRISGPEDVAIQVFTSFVRQAEEQKWTKLESREDLWQILLMLTKRRSQKEFRKENAEKRGGGKVRGESVFAGGSGPAFGSEAVEDVSPEFVMELMDELRHACEQLNDPSLEQVAVLRLQGYENKEIADKLEMSLRSVERKTRLIKKIWKPEA